MRRNFIIIFLIILSIYFLSNQVFSENNSDIYQNVIKNIINLKVNSIYFTLENTSKISKEGYKKLLEDLNLNKILEENKEKELNKYFENYENFEFKENYIYLKAEGFYNKLNKNGKLDLNFKTEFDNQKYLDINLEGRLFLKEDLIYLLLKNFYLNEKISFNSTNSKNIYFKNFIEKNLKNKWIEIEYSSDFSNYKNIDIKSNYNIDIKSLKIKKKIVNYILKNPIFTLNKINDNDKNLDKYEIILNKDNLNNLIKLIEFINIEIIDKDDKLTTEEIEKIKQGIFTIYRLIDKKIGELLIDKKNKKLKEITINLKTNEKLKNEYSIESYTLINLKFNPKININLTKPKKFMKFEDLLLYFFNLDSNNF